ncbi:MAG: hypothetical protein ACTHOC_12780 [Luteimonas sp.]
MATTTRQRLVRFSGDMDALIQERADAMGLTVPEWLRRVVVGVVENQQEEAIRAELQALRAQQSEQLEQTRSELKGFVLEALMAMSERLTASQDAFLRELISALPQASGANASLSELFSSPHRST